MQRIRLLILLVLVVGAQAAGLAQSPAQRIRFEYLTVADGLPENSVSCMLQDHLGFIWLCTQNGLVRYDGTTMTTFPYDAGNPYSLKEGHVRTAIEDRNGDIWLGGSSLYRYERSTGRFIEYPWQTTEKIAGLEQITLLHQDQRGDIWSITMQFPSTGNYYRLNRLRPSTGQWTYFRHNPRNSHSLASSTIYGTNALGTVFIFGFVEDKSRNLWVITAGDTENILHRFDPVSDQFQRIRLQTNDARTAADAKTINLLATDQTGHLYLSSLAAGRGLFRFTPSQQNPQTGQLQHYVHQSANPASLRADSVHLVHVARDGAVWVPTSKGLDRLDPRTGRFTHFVHRTADPASPPPGSLRFMAETTEGNLWFANQTFTKQNLVLYERATGRFIHYPNTPGQEGALQIGKSILSLFIDRTGLVWVGGWTGGVSKQIRQTHFPLLPPVPIQQPGLPPTVIYQAPSDPSVLWLGTAQGLTRQDRRTGQYTHYRYNPLDAHSIGKGPVVAITEDRKGRFWVATRPGGLQRMDRQRGWFERFVHDPADPNSLASSTIQTLLAASTGDIWIGMATGLDQFNPDRRLFRHYYVADTLYAPALYATIGHLSKTNQRLAGIIHPGNNVDQTRAFSLTQPTDVLLISGGCWSRQGRFDYGWLEQADGQRIWEATYAGSRSDGLVSRRDQRNQVVVLRLPAGRYRLRYQSDGSSAYGDWTESPPYHPDLYGIQLLRVTAEEARTVSQFAQQKVINGLGFVDVRRLAEGKRNQIWVGLPVNGLSHLDVATQTFNNYNDYRNGPTAAVGLQVDPQTGDLWVGDYMRGVLHLNPHGQLLKRYTTKDGLPNHNINSLLRDNRGELWLGTMDGLVHLDPRTGQIRHYNRSNGLPELPVRQLAQTTDGTLFVTTNLGTVVVDPTHLADDRRLPPVVLTDLAIHDKPATVGPAGQLPVHISVAKSLTLPYGQNSLTFHFAALQYSRGKECRYAYRLTPGNGQWVQSGTIRQARYNDLQPGDYTFSVKAANPDGYWNEQGARIRVTILSPWWQTGWAYGLYVLLFVVGLRAYIAYRSRSLRRQNQLLEERVAVRTNQVNQQKKEIEIQRDSLKQALTKLKATQAQLIQKEKLASLGELTAGIAHEIQNPLNFVTNYSTLSVKLIDQLSPSPSSAGSGTPADADSDRLFTTLVRNLRKISHHGERASAIVKSMLAHARTSAGEQQPTPLNTLVGDYLKLAYHGHRTKDSLFHCQLLTELDPAIGTIVIAPQEIGQVLLNLFANAFYAIQQRLSDLPERVGPAGINDFLLYHPTLQVRTRRSGQTVEIQVSDNGTGISDRTKDKLFQPFYTTKPLGEGTGLGLSLSYDIVVKGHGGSLTVESQEGEGTTFLIRLPLIESSPGFIKPV